MEMCLLLDYYKINLPVRLLTSISSNFFFRCLLSALYLLLITTARFPYKNCVPIIKVYTTYFITNKPTFSMEMLETWRISDVHIESNSTTLIATLLKQTHQICLECFCYREILVVEHPTYQCWMTIPLFLISKSNLLILLNTSAVAFEKVKLQKIFIKLLLYHDDLE